MTIKQQLLIKEVITMTIYNTIYKITNKINGKTYIGMHKTKNLDDSYMGSGFLIKRAIKFHGKENFEKEILFVFDTYDEMLEKEKELVTESFVDNPMTYNLVCGGLGWDVGNYVVDNNLGIHSLTFSERSNFSKINQANRCVEERKKMCSDGGKLGGVICRKNNLGMFSLTKEQKLKNSQMGIEKQKKNKLARFNSEHQSNLGKIGGPKNKGFKWYTDGVEDFKYTRNQQIEVSFELFLKENSQFKHGRTSGRRPKRICD